MSIAPVASLNADSLIIVCFILSFILVWLNIGTSVAGSVDAIIAPDNKDVKKGTPNDKLTTFDTISVHTKTPILDNKNTVTFTSFNTFKLISFPPR